jgi:hypothetical protein
MHTAMRYAHGRLNPTPTGDDLTLRELTSLPKFPEPHPRDDDVIARRKTGPGAYLLAGVIDELDCSCDTVQFAGILTTRLFPVIKNKD